MHVGLRAFDMVVQVVTEILDMTDRAVRSVWIGEVSWEQDEGNITNIFSLRQARKMPQFEWRVPCGIQDLWSTLDRRQSSCINEFLRVH